MDLRGQLPSRNFVDRTGIPPAPGFMEQVVSAVTGTPAKPAQPPVQRKAPGKDWPQMTPEDLQAIQAQNGSAPRPAIKPDPVAYDRAMADGRRAMQDVANQSVLTSVSNLFMNSFRNLGKKNGQR